MKYLSVLFICLVILSCNIKQNGTKEKQTKIQVAVSIEQMMGTAASNVGNQVCIEGLVNHVCAHSGKRCILKTNDGKLSIRIEATGKLEGFDREIAGNNIKVTGFLREKRLESSQIDKWEADVKAKQVTEKNGESCSSEMANIKEMRDWMKNNDKDYYAIYYIDGTAYEVIK